MKRRYVVLAEYRSEEDKSPGGSEDTIDVLAVFRQRHKAKAFMNRVRASGEYGDFANIDGWSDTGWWLSIVIAPYNPKEEEKE